MRDCLLIRWPADDMWRVVTLVLTVRQRYYHNPLISSKIKNLWRCERLGWPGCLQDKHSLCETKGSAMGHRFLKLWSRQNHRMDLTNRKVATFTVRRCEKGKVPVTKSEAIGEAGRGMTAIKNSKSDKWNCMVQKYFNEEWIFTDNEGYVRKIHISTEWLQLRGGTV